MVVCKGELNLISILITFSDNLSKTTLLYKYVNTVIHRSDIRSTQHVS